MKLDLSCSAFMAIPSSEVDACVCSGVLLRCSSSSLLMSECIMAGALYCLGALSPYLLSLHNKVGAAIYLDAHNDADAITSAPAAFVVSDEFPAIEIWQGKRKSGAGSTRSVPGAMDRDSLRFESTW